jgi:hypothetical protein
MWIISKTLTLAKQFTFSLMHIKVVTSVLCSIFLPISLLLSARACDFFLFCASFSFHSMSLFLFPLADHLDGLSDKWCGGDLWCTEPTKKLLYAFSPKLDPTIIKVLELNAPTMITLDIQRTHPISVWAIEANHCAGSCMFLFRGKLSENSEEETSVLYTGMHFISLFSPIFSLFFHFYSLARRLPL